MNNDTPDYSTYWDNAITQLKKTIPEKEATTWLSKMVYSHSEKGILVAAVSSNFTREYMKRTYKDQLQKYICETAGDIIELQFEIQSSHVLNQMIKERSGTKDQEIVRKEPSQQDIIDQIKDESRIAVNDDGTNKNPIENINLIQPPSSPLFHEDNNTDKENTPLTKNIKVSSFLSVDSKGKTQRNTKRIQDANSEKRAKANLTSRYTFDAFVQGSNSTFAYNAANVIAKNPGINYNPCLIYGGVGLGKTHLLQSIGNYIIDHDPRLRVVYVTAEMFTNEFIDSLKTKNTVDFKNKFRKANVLLVDDIHFLSGKASTQEELFYTFDNLYESKRQMVFTCDRPIAELKDITDRLKSRFKRGLNVDLQPPQYETKFAILKKKCEEQRTMLPDDILDYLCNSINTNVRDLEAALLKLTAYSSLLHEHMTLEKAKKLTGIMPSSIGPNEMTRSITVDDIIKVTAEHFKVAPYDLKGKKRTKSFVIPRQIAMFLAREMTAFSTTEIGSDFGRDHTTVMHAIERIENKVNTDLELKKTVDKIKIEAIAYLGK